MGLVIDVFESASRAFRVARCDAQDAERQASAGAHDGVKGQRRTLAVRAPLHAIVRRSSLGWPCTCEERAEGERVRAGSERTDPPARTTEGRTLASSNVRKPREVASLRERPAKLRSRLERSASKCREDPLLKVTVGNRGRRTSSISGRARRRQGETKRSRCARSAACASWAAVPHKSEGGGEFHGMTQ